MNIIELSDITFRYSDDAPEVFSGFDFAVAAGSCVVVEGENGAGKTTLFRLLNGLSFPQKGRYLFDGCDITARYLADNRNAKLFHKRIGFLFQNPDVMLFNATVMDEVAFGPRQMGLPEDEVRKRTEDCLTLFGIENLSGNAPYHLSGGQKKKVALAAVASLNPDVYVLDEPFAGLDAKSCEALLAFMSDIKAAGKTLIIATHNPLVTTNIADASVQIGL